MTRDFMTRDFMTRMRKPLPPYLIVAVLVGLVIAFPAAADPPTLVGSWSITLVDDVTGGQAPGAFAFGKDGTIVGTTSLEGLSAAIGSWERTGPRSFGGTFIAFAEDGDPQTVLEARNSMDAEVSVDGESLEMELEFVLLLNGVPIASGSAHGTGSRISP